MNKENICKKTTKLWLQQTEHIHCHLYMKKDRQYNNQPCIMYVIVVVVIIQKPVNTFFYIASFLNIREI
jgi:hypothetical protein